MALTRVRFNEQSTGTITGDLVDRDGTAVPGSSLTAATLTLYDWDTGAGGGSPHPGILNARDAQNVLNTNNVTIDSEGHFIWDVQPEDNVIVTARRQVERHRAELVFTWADGEVRHEFEIDVVNLRLSA